VKGSSKPSFEQNFTEIVMRVVSASEKRILDCPASTERLERKGCAYSAAVADVHKKSLPDQVMHWISITDGGEFVEGSMNSFWKTDYEAYEQLLMLGSPIIPCIQGYLDAGNLNRDTIEILEPLLRGLKAN
jgi:hypothetical protein